LLETTSINLSDLWTVHDTVAEACTAIAKAFDVAKNVDKIAREVAAAKKAGKH